MEQEVWKKAFCIEFIHIVLHSHPKVGIILGELDEGRGQGGTVSEGSLVVVLMFGFSGFLYC